MSLMVSSALSTLYAVVISADLMAAGLQSGCACRSSAAMPLTCGHDMDVPEMMLYFTHLVSLSSAEGEVSPVHAARMSTPGAVMSGLRISGARRFGPRLEKDAILGEEGFLPTTVPWNTIVATGDAFERMYCLIFSAAANVTAVAGRM